MIKEKHEIKAEIRTVLGRKVKHLRDAGLVPATIYGHKFESVSIQFNALELQKIYDKVGESGLIELLVGSDKYNILFRNPQYSPVESEIVHIDCYKVNLKEKISAFIPIVLIGESPALKDGNTLVSITDEVEVEALPTDLPESIEIDISILTEVGQMITVEDIKLDEKVTMITLLDQAIVKVEEPRAEEVIEEVTEPVEVPAMNQKTEEEKAAAEAEKADDKDEE